MPATDYCMNTPWAWNKNGWNDTADNQCSDNANNGTLCNGTEAYPIVNTDLSWFVADGHVQGAN